MSEKDNTRNWKLSDFIRYRENKMTPRERNSFERNLQKDPFTEEALEGLEELRSRSVKNDLAVLRKNLQKRTSFKPNILWYRIAASLVILTILTSIFVVFEIRKPAGEISYIPPREPGKEVPVTGGKEKKPEETRIIRPVIIAEAKREKAPAEVHKSEAISDKKLEISEEVHLAENAAVITKEVSEPAKAIVSGRVMEDTAMNKADSLLPGMVDYVVKVSSAKYIGEGKDLKARNYFPPQPVTGQSSFDKYIRDNIRRPDSTSAGQLIVVVLTLRVKINGKVDSIKVIRSPGKSFSDEAIRLIKDGPAWKPAEENGKVIDDEVRINIVFK